MNRPRRLRDALRGRARRGDTAGERADAVEPGDSAPADGGDAPRAGTRTPAYVPYGIDLAAAWGWRVLVIAAAGYVLYRVLSYFSEFTVPVAVAALVTALIIPFVDALERLRVPRSLAALIVLLGTIGFVSGVLALVGQQVSMQFDEMRVAVLEGIDQIHAWARKGPLGLSDAELAAWIDRVQQGLQPGEDRQVVDRVAQAGATLTRVLTGLVIVLFASFFFCYEGERIWGWVVRLTPRAARSRIDSSGRVAWTSLTSFVRGTVIVALIDSIGIGAAAFALQIPMALAIAALVFVGAFVPIVGAFVSGIVAVLVALVAQGPWAALLMLLAVVAVQQIESNVLQPFLMGKMVAVHPLAIILAIGAGITLSGIAGALVAVPTVACVNAVVRHLSDTAPQAR